MARMFLICWGLEIQRNKASRNLAAIQSPQEYAPDCLFQLYLSPFLYVSLRLTFSHFCTLVILSAFLE